MIAPKLRDYNVNVLAAFGDREQNEVRRNQIKLLIIEKILNMNSSMFILINRFMGASGILKDSYAEVITMMMKDSNYCINESFIDEIVCLTTLDSLIYYGAESKNKLFAEKCVSEFWSRASEVEDKNGLIKKKGKKRKVIENDKY